MDWRGTVTVVEEASRIGEAGGIEVDSQPSYGMVCRLVRIVLFVNYWAISEIYTRAVDDALACWQWIGVVPSL